MKRGVQGGGCEEGSKNGEEEECDGAWWQELKRENGEIGLASSTHDS